MALQSQEIKNEAFEGLNPTQKEAIYDLYEKVKNKSLTEMLPILMNFSAKNKINMSPKQKESIISAFLEQLPPEEKGKFQGIMKVLV